MKELLEESRNAKEQVAIIQERVRALQQEALTKETQLAAARQEVQELRVHAVRATVYRPDQTRLMTDTRPNHPSAVRGADARRHFRRSPYLLTPSHTPPLCCNPPASAFRLFAARRASGGLPCTFN